MPEPELSAATLPQRNIAIDAYRGVVMLLMLAEVLHLAQIAQSYPHSPIWQVLAFNQSHVEWTGLSLHDTIQPSFIFLVGVSLPYSLRSRRRRGQRFPQLLAHALLRSLILIALAAAIGFRGPYAPLDVLSQIGLGYTFLFLISLTTPRWQGTAFIAILLATWLIYVLYPLPPPTYSYAAAGVPADWSPHLLHGFSAHWNKNSNAGFAFDRWLLNRIPRHAPYAFDSGGYTTLNFLPSIATMILGLTTGRWLLEAAPRIPMRRLTLAGLALIVSGLLLHATGLCPIVKRLWTPSFTLLSGGLCILTLAAFAWIIEVRYYRRWAFPLVVIGMNSIAAYLLVPLWGHFFARRMLRLAATTPHLANTPLQPLAIGAFALALEWLILYAMYRKRLFLRI